MDLKEYHLGCSGWYYNHWIQRFYPESLKKSDWLEYYAEHFNTVEINSTFYRFPTEKMLNVWYKKTPDNFLFTLKVNQLITHRKKFKDTQDLLTRFYKLSEILENKLGCLLFQIPPYISRNMEFLENLIDQLDSSKKNVIEFRDSSWFNEEVYKVLRENQVEFCSVSAPDLPDDLITTSSLIYLRFHGTGDRTEDETKDATQEKYHHLYSEEELEDRVQKIKESAAREVFCYFNNDYQANAVLNCEQLREMLI